MIIEIPDKYIERWTKALTDDGYYPPATSAEWANLVVTYIHENITHGEQPEKDMLYEANKF